MRESNPLEVFMNLLSSRFVRNTSSIVCGVGRTRTCRFHFRHKCVYTFDVFPIITIRSGRKLMRSSFFISPLPHILLRLQESNLLSVGYEPPMISVFVVIQDVSVSLCHDIKIVFMFCPQPILCFAGIGRLLHFDRKLIKQTLQPFTRAILESNQALMVNSHL